MKKKQKQRERKRDVDAEKRQTDAIDRRKKTYTKKQKSINKPMDKQIVKNERGRGDKPQNWQIGLIFAGEMDQRKKKQLETGNETIS